MGSLYNLLRRSCRTWQKILTPFAVNQVKVTKTFTDDAASSLQEPTRVTILPLIEPKRLLVQIPKQMKWLHAHISPFDTPLEKAPEVFLAVINERVEPTH